MSSTELLMGTCVMKNTDRQRGFSLLEAMIVLGLVSALLVVAGSLFRDQMRQQAKDNWTLTEARELALLLESGVRYAQKIMFDNATAYPVGQTYVVGVSTLVSQRFLDASFANRLGATGTTPFAQRYAVYVRKEWVVDSEGNPTTEKQLKVLVTESGEMSTHQVRRAGVAPSAEDLAGLKNKIAMTAFERYDLTTGIIRAGQTEASAPNGSWELDMAEFFENTTFTAIDPVAAVFWGFDELDPDDINDDDCEFNPDSPACEDEGIDFTQCDVILGDPISRPWGESTSVPDGYTNAQCPVGMSELARVDACNDEAAPSSGDPSSNPGGMASQPVTFWWRHFASAAATMAYRAQSDGSLNRYGEGYGIAYGVFSINGEAISQPRACIDRTTVTCQSVCECRNSNGTCAPVGTTVTTYYWAKGGSHAVCCPSD